MMSSVFIDRYTYDILDEENSNCFAVDKRIANSVSLLNKNGYKTTSSFIGDVYKGEFIEHVVDEKESDYINMLLNVSYEIPRNGHNRIFRVPVINTDCHISFERIDNLPSIPNGFKVVGNSLYCFISYVSNFETFFDDGIRDSFLIDYRVEEKIEETVENLNNWVMTFCD